MLRSMTGFSSRIVNLPSQNKLNKDICLTISLKSLNSRFFEFNCKLPFWLTSIETDLLKHIKSKLIRGNIFLSVYSASLNNISEIKPSIPMLSNYLNALEDIKKSFGLEGNIAIKDILTLPNIFDEKELIPNQNFIDQVMLEIDSLTESLIKARIAEGAFIEKDLLNRVKEIKSLLAPLKKRSKIVFDDKKIFINKKVDKIKEESKAISSTDQALFQNLTLYNQLDKIDIHEEIIRFDLHLKSLSALLKSEEIEKGKKIDFIVQELFREINTITAKCSDAQISGLAIDIKVELEKIREQAQNIL